MQQRTYQKKGPAGKLKVVREGSGTPLAMLAHEFGQEEAQLAAREGQLAYLAGLLVQLTMPHSRPATHEYMRTNHVMTVVMAANAVEPKTGQRIGLPYGSIPRLVLAWLCTRAVQTKDRDIRLGRSLSEFMDHLGLGRTGGTKGDITRLKAQVKKLFACTMTATAHVQMADPQGRLREGTRIQHMALVDNSWLPWDPVNPEQLSLESSTVRLSEQFYRAIVDHPVPLDSVILARLRRSPMALDVYAWLTWRLPQLREPTTVPWEALQLQFGAEYKRLRAFREKFLGALRTVVGQYPDAKVEPTPAGLLLKPSKPSVPRLR